MFKRAITRIIFNEPADTEKLDGAVQALLEVDRGPVAEHALRLADVRPRVAHVARPRLLVALLDRLAEDTPHRVGELVHARGRPGRDVEDPPAGAVGLAGAHGRVDDIGDVREVARLLAVAEDRDRLPGGDPRDEERHDPGRSEEHTSE